MAKQTDGLPSLEEFKAVKIDSDGLPSLDEFSSLKKKEPTVSESLLPDGTLSLPTRSTSPDFDLSLPQATTTMRQQTQAPVVQPQITPTQPQPAENKTGTIASYLPDKHPFDYKDNPILPQYEMFEASKRGDFKKSDDIAMSMIEKNPADPYAYRMLYYNTKKQGTPNLDLLQRAIQHNPSDMALIADMAFVSKNMGDLQSASQYASQIATMVPPDSHDIPSLEYRDYAMGILSDVAVMSGDQDAARGFVKQREQIAEQIKKKTPTSEDWMLSQAINNSMIGRGLRAGLPEEATNPEFDIFRNYQPSTTEELIAGLGSLILDLPAFGPGGSIGSGIAKGTMSMYRTFILKKAAQELAKKGLSKEAINVGLSQMSKKLMTSGITGSAMAASSSAGALGYYDAGSDFLRQLADGATIEDVDYGQALKRFEHGTALGMMIGPLGYGTNVARKAAQTYINRSTDLIGMGAKATKVGADVGIGAAGFGAENVAFVGGGALLDGKDLGEITTKDWVMSFGTLAGLKGVNMVKGWIKSGSFTDDKVNTGEFKVEFTEAEAEAIRRLGYDGQVDPTLKNPEPILADPTIPQTAKMKIMWAGYGVRPAEFPAIYAVSVTEKDGKWNVITTNKEGAVVTSENFATREQANEVALQAAQMLKDVKTNEAISEFTPEQKADVLEKLKLMRVEPETVEAALDKPPADRTAEDIQAINVLKTTIDELPPAPVKTPEANPQEATPTETKAEAAPQPEAVKAEPAKSDGTGSDKVTTPNPPTNEKETQEGQGLLSQPEEKATTPPPASKVEGEGLSEKVPKHIVELYIERNTLETTANALRQQMRGNKLTGKAKSEYDNVTSRINELNSKIADFENSIPVGNQEAISQSEVKETTIVESKPEISDPYGSFLMDKVEKSHLSKYPNETNVVAAVAKEWNRINEENGTIRANSYLEDMVTANAPKDERVGLSARLRNEYKSTTTPVTPEQVKAKAELTGAVITPNKEVKANPAVEPKQKESTHHILKTIVNNIIPNGNDLRDVEELVLYLSGDRNKAMRQELMTELIGQKLPIAKCGVTALDVAVKKWIRDKYPDANVTERFKPIIQKYPTIAKQTTKKEKSVSTKPSEAIDTTSPEIPEGLLDSEFPQWVFENSNNPDDIVIAYKQELNNNKRTLLKPWQERLLEWSKFKIDSFYMFGDPNKMNKAIGSAWIAKKTDKGSSRQIDDFVRVENDEFNSNISENDVIEFIIDNPNGYVRKTTDLQNNLANKYKMITGQSIRKVLDMTAEIKKNEVPSVFDDFIRTVNIDPNKATFEEMSAMLESKKDEYFTGFPFTESEYTELKTFLDNAKAQDDPKRNSGIQVGSTPVEQRTEPGERQKGKLERELDAKIAKINEQITRIEKERKTESDRVAKENANPELGLEVAKKGELIGAEKANIKGDVADLDGQIRKLKEERAYLESTHESTKQADNAQGDLFEQQPQLSNEVNDAVSKYGWSAEPTDTGYDLYNSKGKKVVTVKVKGDKYSMFDQSGAKLLSGNKNIAQAAEGLLKDYYYAKEIAAVVKAEAKPSAPKQRIEFERNDEKIKKELADIDDLLKELGKPDLTMGGLSKIDKLTELVAKLVKVGYYKIEDIGKFLIEKGYNDLLPQLKEAYTKFKDESDLSLEVKTSLSNGKEINEYNPAGSSKATPEKLEAGTDIQGRPITTGATGGTGGRRPPIRIADEADLPTPSKEHIVDGRYDIDEHQRFAANLAIDRYEGGGKSFLLADGAGVGKTREILAIANERKSKGGKVLIVSLGNVIESNYRKDAKAMGINLSDFEIGTYTDLVAGKIGKGEYDLAIYDESQNLKNTLSQRAITQAKVKSKHNLFASATPMDKVEHAVYFMSEITGKPQKEIESILGIDIRWVKDKDGELRPWATTSLGVDHYLDKLIELRNGAIKQGAMIRRDYPFYGDITNEQVRMPGELQSEVLRVETIHQERIDNATNIAIMRLVNERLGGGKQFGGEMGQFKSDLANYMQSKGMFDEIKKDYEDGKMNQNYWDAKSAIDKFIKDERFKMLANIDKLNESSKVEEAYNRAKKELADGKQVVIVGNYVNDHTVKAGTPNSKYGYYERKIPASDTFLSGIEKKLKEDGYKIAKIFGGNKNKSYTAEQNKFQSKEARVLLMTSKSGGTGIDLDDVVGDSPRKMIVATGEYAGDTFEQLLGRVSRRNTKSPANVEIMYYDNNVSDANRLRRSEEKQKVIRSIVSGTGDLDAGRLNVDKEGIFGKETVQQPKQEKPKADKTPFIEERGNGIVVKNSFEIKDQLKAAGGKFVKDMDGWLFPKTSKEKVEKIINDRSLADKAPRAGDFLRKAKFVQSTQDLNKMQSNPLGIVQVAWDGLIEVSAKAIDAGASLTKAIRDGLEYMRKQSWYKAMSKKDKQATEDTFVGYINQEYKKTEPTTLEDAVKIYDTMKANEKAEQKSYMEKMKASSKRWIARLLYDKSDNAKKLLQNENPIEGQRASELFQLLKGTSTKTAREAHKAQEDIYGSLADALLPGGRGIMPIREQELLGEYLNALRIIELDNLYDSRNQLRLKHTGDLTKEAAEVLIDAWKNNTNGILEKQFGIKGDYDFNKIEVAAEKYHGIMAQKLKEMYDAGLLTPEAYDKLSTEQSNYSPREFLQHIDQSPEGGGSLSGVRALKEGSYNSIIKDPSLLLTHVIARANGRIARNNANQALSKFAEATPSQDAVRTAKLTPEYYERIKKEQKRVDEKNAQLKLDGLAETEVPKFIEPEFEPTPKGYAPIDFLVEGKQQRIFVEEWFKSEWDAVTTPEWYAITLNALSWASGVKPLKMMATGYNPSFPLTNMPLDMFHIWMTTDVFSPVLPIAMGQMVKSMAVNIKDISRRQGKFDDFVKGGGYSGTLTSQGNVKFKAKKYTTRSEAAKFLNKAAAYAGETSEIATRIAIADKVFMDGLKQFEKDGVTPTKEQVDALKDKANATSRHYLEFSDRGYIPEFLEAIVPYFNAGVQVSRGTIRYAKNNPKMFAFKTAQVIGVASLLAAWNLGLFGGSDEEKEKRRKKYLEDINDRNKANYWNILMNRSYIDSDGNERMMYFKTPADNTMIGFKNIAEDLIIMAMFPEEKTKFLNRKRLIELQGMLKNVGDLNSLPPVLNAIRGYQDNFDNFYKAEIWKGRDFGSDKGLEYYDNTPAMYKALGKVGLSPIRSEFAVESITTKNNPFYIALEKGLSTLSEYADPSLAPYKDQIDKQWRENIRQIPFANRFLGTTDPRAGKDKIKEIEQAENRIKGKNDKELEKAVYKNDFKEVGRIITDTANTDAERKRLTGKFVDLARRRGVPTEIVNLTFLSTKPRAEALYNIYLKQKYDPQNTDKLAVRMLVVGGIITDQLKVEIANGDYSQEFKDFILSK